MSEIGRNGGWVSGRANVAGVCRVGKTTETFLLCWPPYAGLHRKSGTGHVQTRWGERGVPGGNEWTEVAWRCTVRDLLGCEEDSLVQRSLICEAILENP